MRGLIVKDWRLILQKRRFLVLFLVMGLFMGRGGGTAALVYMTLVAVILSLSTVSYDEYEKGYTFLMTLPFDRKTYVREKYVFAVLVGTVAFLVSCAVLAVSLTAQGKGLSADESVVSVFGCLAMAVLIVDVTLPLQLKFGAEQGRIALFVVTAAVAIVGGIGMELLQGHVSSEKIIEIISGLGQWGIVGCIIGAVALFTLVSYGISVRVMEKKEF